MLGRRNVIAQTQSDHLGRIGDRAAANRQNEISVRRARLVRCRDHIDPRRVSANLRTHTGQAITQNIAYGIDNVGLARQRAARHNVNRTRVAEPDFLRQCFRQRHTVNDPVHGRETVGTSIHGRHQSFLQGAVVLVRHRDGK